MTKLEDILNALKTGKPIQYKGQEFVIESSNTRHSDSGNSMAIDIHIIIGEV